MEAKIPDVLRQLRKTSHNFVSIAIPAHVASAATQVQVEVDVWGRLHETALERDKSAIAILQNAQKVELKHFWTRARAIPTIQ